jgi:hypothetical protein
MLKVVSAACLVGTIAFAGSALAGPSTQGRASMERCVKATLSKLAQSRAPEAQAGPAVVARCDGPLRAALVEAINNGEAFICTVESCIGMARERAAEEARAAYRRFVTSRL